MTTRVAQLKRVLRKIQSRDQFEGLNLGESPRDDSDVQLMQDRGRQTPCQKLKMKS